MAERLSDEILQGTYVVDAKIPGVREYSALLEVNVNTAVKAYDYLSQRGIIYTRRGLGYFVSPEARNLILNARRAEFRKEVLPDFIRRMRQLDIPLSVVEAALSRGRTSRSQHLKGIKSGRQAVTNQPPVR